MKAVRVQAQMVINRHMKLHRCFMVLEEQAFDVFHLGPVRASILPTDANVVPAFIT